MELQDVDKDVIEDTYASSKAQILGLTPAGKRSALKSKGKQAQPVQKDRSPDFISEELSRKMLEDKDLTVA